MNVNDVSTIRNTQVWAKPAGHTPQLDKTQEEAEPFFTQEETECINLELLALQVMNQDCQNLNQEQTNVLEARKKALGLYRPLSHNQLSLLKLLPGRAMLHLDRLAKSAPQYQEKVNSIKSNLFEMQIFFLYYLKGQKERYFDAALAHLQKVQNEMLDLEKKFHKNTDFIEAKKVTDLFSEFSAKRKTLFPILLRPLKFDVNSPTVPLLNMTFSYLHPDSISYLEESAALMRTACLVARNKLNHMREQKEVKRFLSGNLSVKIKLKLESYLASFESEIAKREKRINEFEQGLPPLKRFFNDLLKGNKLDGHDFTQLKQFCLKRFHELFMNDQREFEDLKSKLETIGQEINVELHRNPKLALVSINQIIDPIDLASKKIVKRCLGNPTQIIAIASQLLSLFHNEIGPIADCQSLLRSRSAKAGLKSCFFSQLDVITDFFLEVYFRANQKLNLNVQTTFLHDFTIALTALYMNVQYVEDDLEARLYSPNEDLSLNKNIKELRDSYVVFRNQVDPLLTKTEKQLMDSFIQIFIGSSVQKDGDFRVHSIVPWIHVVRTLTGSSKEITEPVRQQCQKLCCNAVAMCGFVQFMLSAPTVTQAYYDSLGEWPKKKVKQAVEAYFKDYADEIFKFKQFLENLSKGQASDFGALSVKIDELSFFIMGRMMGLEVEFQTIMETEYLTLEDVQVVTILLNELKTYFTSLHHGIIVPLQIPSRKWQAFAPKVNPAAPQPEDQQLSDDFNWRPNLDILQQLILSTSNSLSNLPPQGKNEHFKRKNVMQNCLREIQYNNLLVLHEASDNLKAGFVNFVEVENYCQSAALLLENTLKFALAHFDCCTPTGEHVLFTRNAASSQKLLSSEHKMTVLADSLKGHIVFSSEDKELLEQFSAAIVFFTQSLYFKANTLGSTLLQLRNNDEWDVDAVCGDSPSQHHACSLTKFTAYKHSLGTVLGKVESALELSLRIMGAMTKASASTQSVQEDSRVRLVLLCPGLLASQDRILEQVKQLSNNHPTAQYMPRDSIRNNEFRNFKISHCLYALQRSMRDFSRLLMKPAQVGEFGYIKSLLSKTALAIQEAIVLPELLLPIPGTNPDMHAIFDIVASFSQKRPRYNSHDLSDHFKVLNHYLHNAIKLDQDEGKALMQLNDVLGCYARYLGKPHQSELGDALCKIAENGYVQMTNPQQPVLDSTEQRNKLLGIATAGLQIVEKLLAYTLSLQKATS